jgi:hypothetical protein
MEPGADSVSGIRLHRDKEGVDVEASGQAIVQLRGAWTDTLNWCGAHPLHMAIIFVFILAMAMINRIGRRDEAIAKAAYQRERNETKEVVTQSQLQLPDPEASERTKR